MYILKEDAKKLTKIICKKQGWVNEDVRVLVVLEMPRPEQERKILAEWIVLAIPHIHSIVQNTLHIIFQISWSRFLYLPTPLLGQDMTQGQFLSGV